MGKKNLGDYTGFDGVIRSRFHFQPHTEVLTHIVDQPTEDLILQRNADLRKNPEVIKDLGAESEGGTWGRSIACIPENLYYKAIRDGYELNATDKEHRSKELFRYLNSEEGRKCKIRG